MALHFESQEPLGEDFVKLFSAQNFSIHNIEEYVEKRRAAEVFATNVEKLIEDMTSSAFHITLNGLIEDYYKAKGNTPEEIQEALSQINIIIDKNIANHSKQLANKVVPPIIDVSRESRPRIYREGGRNNLKARRYAYNLIKQILEKNKSLTFQ